VHSTRRLSFSIMLLTEFASRLDAPEYWHGRAAEMRKIGEGLAHLPRAQAPLLETAKEYDRRAARADVGLAFEQESR
jgi:hypothetical protein